MPKALVSFRKESEADAHEQEDHLHDRNWACQQFAVSCYPCGWNRMLWDRKSISWLFPDRSCGSDPIKRLILLSFEGSDIYICFWHHIHGARVIFPSSIPSPAAPTARTASVYSEKVKIFWISSVASSHLLTLQFQYETHYSVEAVCNIV